MAEKDLSGIILPAKKMLVELLPNYFNEHKTGTLDKQIRNNQNFNVGVIRKLSSKPVYNEANITGRVVYFEKDLAPVVNFKNLGEYHIVHEEHHVLAILPETAE